MMAERSVSDLVFRPESPGGPNGGAPTQESLREELARLARRAHPERVVPAGRAGTPPDEPRAAQHQP